MPINEELSRLLSPKDTALTVGIFDGVHLGHKYLLSQLIEQAERQNLLSAVVTFFPHPLKLLESDSKLLYLTDLEKKKALLKKEGADNIIVLPFSRELARLSAREFAGMLKEYLKMKVLVLGTGATLGNNREGDTATLSKMGKEMGFTLIDVPPITINGETVSSTAVRQALVDGDLIKADRLLGRPFDISGIVSCGTGTGASLNYPTANLKIDPEQALPTEGVYATRAYIGDKKYQSVTNIGRRPTFGSKFVTIEVHILGFQGNLYGQELKIDIIERIRSEIKFDSASELKKQISRDIETGKAILNRENGE